MGSTTAITLLEAARRTGLDKSTLRRQVKAGKLSASRDPNRGLADRARASSSGCTLPALRTVWATWADRGQAQRLALPAPVRPWWRRLTE
jgi:hypothetical protein